MYIHASLCHQGPILLFKAFQHLASFFLALTPGFGSSLKHMYEYFLYILETYLLCSLFYTLTFEKRLEQYNMNTLFHVILEPWSVTPY